MTTKMYRGFRLLQTAGALRTAVHAPGDPGEQREHLVVPVIALMEGVIHPVNAETPELVLERELAEVAAAWNGEPATWDHPAIVVGGAVQRVSANDPDVLAKYRVGTLFNADVRDGKLHVEAWIDKARALAMGGEAADLVARLEAGEQIEVSVGAFVITEASAGEHNGKRYAQIWREIYPDHLAMLPAGTIGACSNEMGCGVAPTSASLHTLSSDGRLLAPTRTNTDGDPDQEKPGMFAKLLDTVRGLTKPRAAQDGRSDNDIRAILGAALFSSEPAFLSITDVFHDDGKVIYETAVDDTFRLFERTFTVGDDDAVTFGEPAEVRLEVETNFVPVEAAGAAPCGCGNPAAACACGNEPGETDMDKATRVAALIAAEATAYTADDTDGLMAMSEDTLTALEASAAAPAEPIAPVAPVVPVVDPVAGDDAEDDDDPAAAAPLDAEAWMAAAPDDIRAEFEELRAAKMARHDALVVQLVGAQKVHDEPALSAMSVRELENILALINIPDASAPVDFSGLGMPRAATASEGEDERPEPAPDLATAIAKRQPSIN